MWLKTPCTIQEITFKEADKMKDIIANPEKYASAAPAKAAAPAAAAGGKAAAKAPEPEPEAEEVSETMFI
jgi:large subunit ribosomal protein LP0